MSNGQNNDAGTADMAAIIPFGSRARLSEAQPAGQDAVAELIRLHDVLAALPRGPLPPPVPPLAEAAPPSPAALAAIIGR